jgi:hypothetical protein
MVDSVMRVKDPSCNGFGKTVGGIDDQVNIPAFSSNLECGERLNIKERRLCCGATGIDHLDRRGFIVLFIESQLWYSMIRAVPRSTIVLGYKSCFVKCEWAAI